MGVYIILTRGAVNKTVLFDSNLQSLPTHPSPLPTSGAVFWNSLSPEAKQVTNLSSFHSAVS